MPAPFVEANTASRRRLEALLRCLSAADLGRPTPYGGTVAALLAHLAFWDQRVLVLLRRWKTAGVDSSPIDADAVNEALQPLCLALDPGTAVALCLASAEAVDAELEALPASLVEAIQAQIEAQPFQFRFNRALHRDSHLDDIAQFLQDSPHSGA